MKNHTYILKTLNGRVLAGIYHKGDNDKFKIDVQTAIREERAADDATIKAPIDINLYHFKEIEVKAKLKEDSESYKETFNLVHLTIYGI